MNIETTENGYLTNIEDWDIDVAEYLANQENINLTTQHWLVINFVRDFYFEFNIAPNNRAIINYLKEKTNNAKINSTYLQQLFPSGPATQAVKIAGLPKPVKCL